MSTLLFCSFALVPAQESYTYTIEYTGATFGYARIPDTDTLIQRNDPLIQGKRGPLTGTNASGGDRSPAAKDYEHLFKAAGVVRVGMGDNFAPALLSRTFQVTDPRTGSFQRLPKDRFAFQKDRWVDCANQHDDCEDTRPIPSDNVAQFFINNHYDAMVAGKHDFYFGPQRLQELAELLKSGGVHMLGANLTLVTAMVPTPMNTFPRTPERFANHRFGAGRFSTDFKQVSIDLPDMTFPYKRLFVARNARRIERNGQKVARSELETFGPNDIPPEDLLRDVHICWEPDSKGPTSGKPDEIPLPGASDNCARMIATEACPKGEDRCLGLEQPKHASVDVTYIFKDRSKSLQGGRNHLFCAQWSGAKGEHWVCQPFYVQKPFFDGKPYALSRERKIAIFGVVDPDLLSNVGLLNYGWLNQETPSNWLWRAANGEKYPYDTNTKVAAADATLKQVLELCKEDAACRGARKLVLAQMPYAKASELIAHFKTDLDAAVSQASRDHRTGDLTIGGRERSPALLTPDSPYGDPEGEGASGKSRKCFHASVSTAWISKDNSGWTLKNTEERGGNLYDGPSRCSGSDCETLGVVSQKTLQHMGVNFQPDKEDPVALSPSDYVTYLALLAMQERTKADMAFLQERDLFDADAQSSAPIPPGDIQNQINRVLWKGDFVKVIHVTGATLRKVMKQSKAFSDLDNNLLTTDVEKGRALITLGLYKDPLDSGTYYINRVRMDDAALYSVAVTQYIGAGDTGYADLATPDVPPALRVEDLPPLHSVANLVCKKIQQKLGAQAGCWEDEPLQEGYFDEAKGFVPPDATPGFDTKGHYRTFLSRFLFVPDIRNAADRLAEDRHFFSLNLESMDLNYTGTYIYRAALAKTRFAGVSAPGITTTPTNTINFDYKLREVWDFTKGTLYALSDMNVARSSTAPLPSISGNTYGLEGGVTLRLLHPNRASWLSAQMSGRYEGEPLAPSDTEFMTSPPVFLKNPSISTVYGRGGFRIEHADTYLETGLEEIDSRNFLQAYLFNVHGVPTNCVPNESQTLTCTSSGSPSSEPFSTYFQGVNTVYPFPAPKLKVADYLNAGAYLNFSMKFPLWSRRDITLADQSVYLLLTNRGDLYFRSHADTVVQTRYLDRLSFGVSFPIYGKLALMPRLDTVLYQRKGPIVGSHYLAFQPTLALSYTFKQREGMTLRRAWGYGAITTPQPPPPSSH